MITSADNYRVKQARALLDQRGREAQNHCLIEGVRLIEEAMRAGIVPALVFFTDQARNTARSVALLDAASSAGAQLLELSPQVFGTLSDTVTSQGIIAEIVLPRPAPPEQAQFVLVLDRLRDPGNLGTILRSAEAAAVETVVLAPGCVDPWNPKVVRSGMGAHFHLRLLRMTSWTPLEALLMGLPVWLADAHGAMDYDEVNWTVPCALVVGGEAEGVSAEARQLGIGNVAIPIAGAAESLNAAMAATVLVFERARQLKRTPQPGGGV
jgi:RNA methyltransferase, TrmH family